MDPDRVQFSAKFETPFFVTNTAVASVRDVLICATDAGAVELDDEEWREHPPIGSPWQLLHENPWLQREDPAPFDLGRGVTVERLSDDEAEPVMNARSPRGHNF